MYDLLFTVDSRYVQIRRSLLYRIPINNHQQKNPKIKKSKVFVFGIMTYCVADIYTSSYDF
jgi:hypothetical protein